MKFRLKAFFHCQWMQENRIAIVAAIFSTLLFGALTVNVSAQLTTADVLGTVTDASGAIVPGATITIKNLATGVSSSTKSNESGDYIFNLLPPGHYSVVIEAKSFKKVEYADVALAAGDRARENGVLQAGAAEETIQVTSAPPLLQTDSSSVSSVVTEQAVQDLPLNGRNFVNLVQIQPGVTAGQPNAIGSGTRPDDRRQSSVVSANGQSDLFNNEMIEGMDNNEREQGFLGVRPSIDAISEVKVDTNAFNAEIGRSAGAVVNIITKAGANDLHGTAYEFFRNDIFDARDYFTTVASGVAKPEYRQNQFGGSIGGPIVKNRTFFFGDAEDNRNIVGQSTGLLTVPTCQEQGYASDCKTSTGVYDFSDNGGGPVPAAYASAVGLAYLKMYPKPNVPGAGLVNNFIAAPHKTQYALSADGRIDQNFKNGDLLFGRYSYNNISTSVPGAFPSVSEAGTTIQPGGNFFSFPGTSTTKAHNAQFNYVHMLTPNLVMELKAGYTRIDIETGNLNQGKNVSSAIGLVNANTPDAPQTTGLTPLLFIQQGYAGLGDSFYLPILDKNNTFQYMGSLTWTHGAHNIKAGAQFTRRQLNYFQSSYPLGWVFFEGVTGNSLQDLLYGLPIGYYRGNTLIQPGYRASEFGVYGQDDWRLTRTLTLNLGIRYDIYDPITEAHNRYANFEYNTVTNNGAIILGSQDPQIGVDTNYANFAPRVGFSQSIGKATVVRGGYGISFYPLAIQGQIQAANPPYQYNTSCFPCSPLPYPGFGPFPWPTLPIPTASSTTNLSGSLTYLPKDFNTAYVQQFNLMVQQQIGANVITVGGVGELGRHQLFQPYINVPAPNGPYPNDATQGPPAPPALLTASTLPNVGQIQVDAPWGTSNYYALQAVFARRFTKGLSLNANYTWAHGLSDAISGSAQGGATGEIATDPHYDYGNSAVDVRNRFSANWNYKLPFGESASGGKAVLIKGWEANFIIFWQSGNSFAVVDEYSNSNGVPQINLPTLSPNTGDRPNLVPGVSYRSPGGSINNWLNLSAFTPQAAGTPGDEKNGALYGPHQRRADMSIFKNFNVTEKFLVQFRAEAYNISNTPNFPGPGNAITSWTPGPEHTAATPISKVGLLPGDIPTAAGGFGVISSTTPNVNPRQFQFALKLIY